MRIGFISRISLLGISFAQLVFSNHPLSRHIQIMNESGRKVEVLWINPNTGEPTKVSDANVIYNGASFPLNSFVNHTFLLRDVSRSNEGNCAPSYGDDNCGVGYMTVSESSGDQVFFIKKDLTVEHMDSKAEARAEAHETMDGCRSRALNAAFQSKEGAKQAMEDLMSCMEESVAERLEQKNEELAFERKTRESIGNMLENYTCTDSDLPTTEPEDTRMWTYKGTTREVRVMHEREASKIHLIPGFISWDECQAIEQAARPILHRGTVADGKGGSRLSDQRKAMQAGVKIPWDKERQGDPIARLTRRVYDYANHATGYDMEVEGQEDIMSIQYFGRGANDTAPDQYRPHCDGDCGGLPHKTGGRVATMVMYCTVPEKGGATNFANAGVHIKPEFGAAAFFSYMHPTKHIMDTGFTSHSGCPVTEGTKRIAVQWMRIGVDKHKSWDSFNTLTIKREEEEN